MPLKPPFWRRGDPRRQHDIALLRPADKPKGQRFETSADARAESERSERLLRSFADGNKELAEFLQECRAGDYECDRPFCPICARLFRRWFIGELLRIAKEKDPVQIYTVLLKEKKRDQLNDLCPAVFRHLIRKRLKRAGLGKTPVIGGFEIVYKAERKIWVFHANLVIFGGKNAARKKFKHGFKRNSDINRPIIKEKLKDPFEQLSYILKFTTYHRPHKQTGPKRTDAKPLNPVDHAALVRWMAQFEFRDFLFLMNTRREGTKIMFRHD